MILKRFSCIVIIRVTAILSVLLGLLYLPSHYSIPLNILGPELEGAQQLTKLWAMYAICAGVIVFITTFLLKLRRLITFKRIILATYLMSTLFFVVAQLLPLFWWVVVLISVFSWSSLLGLVLHLTLLLFAIWGATLTSYTIYQLKQHIKE